MRRGGEEAGHGGQFALGRVGQRMCELVRCETALEFELDRNPAFDICRNFSFGVEYVVAVRYVS